jgi:hypothetical protein
MPQIGQAPSTFTDEELITELRRRFVQNSVMAEAMARLLENRAKPQDHPCLEYMAKQLTDDLVTGATMAAVAAGYDGTQAVTEVERPPHLGYNPSGAAPDTSTGHIAWQPESVFPALCGYGPETIPCALTRGHKGGHRSA